MTARNPKPSPGAEYLTTEEAAKRLRLKSVQTMRKWRYIGFGPPYIKVSEKLVLYTAEDIDTWLKSNRVDPADAA